MYRCYTMLVGYSFDYSEEKNLVLKATRKISFEDVIEAVAKGKQIADLKHASKKYSNQSLLVVEIDKYIYVAPYVVDKKRKKKFLKTVYASRKLTKKYIKHEK